MFEACLVLKVIIFSKLISLIYFNVFIEDWVVNACIKFNIFVLLFAFFVLEIKLLFFLLTVYFQLVFFWSPSWVSLNPPQVTETLCWGADATEVTGLVRISLNFLRSRMYVLCCLEYICNKVDTLVTFSVQGAGREEASRKPVNCHYGFHRRLHSPSGPALLRLTRSARDVKSDDEPGEFTVKLIISDWVMIRLCFPGK